jgi:hypothetical protein
MTGAEQIAVERQRQVSEEKWTPHHDDGHTSGELAMAAACYAAPEPIFRGRHVAAGYAFTDPWPWLLRADLSGRGAYDGDKRKAGNAIAPMPKDGPERIRFLVRAGALIAAEIDRLQRAQEG